MKSKQQVLDLLFLRMSEQYHCENLGIQSDVTDRLLKDLIWVLDMTESDFAGFVSDLEKKLIDDLKEHGFTT